MQNSSVVCPYDLPFPHSPLWPKILPLELQDIKDPSWATQTGAVLSCSLSEKDSLLFENNSLYHIEGAPPQALYVDAIFIHQIFTEHSLGQELS